MFSKSFSLAALALGLALSFGAQAQAQQTQQQQGGDREQQKERGGRRRGGPRGPGFGMHVLRELNLSEAQQQQARAIFDRFAASIQPQREQLMQLREQRKAGNAPSDTEERAKALRSQIHDAEKAMRAELLNILTPEQRAQLEQLQKERKARRDQRRQRRQNDGPETK